MNKSYVYSFIPIGVALVAGGIQTAIIGYSFSAQEWYIAALLIVCVWLTAGMDAAAFHHSAVSGATWAQKIFLAISALSLVVVLSVDLVWMFAPGAFNTTDAIIKDLSYATGVNLAVSALCLLAWIFFSQDHADDREAAQQESDAIRERRLAFLESPNAQALFDQLVSDEILSKIAKRQRRAKYVIAQSTTPTKTIEQPKSAGTVPSKPTLTSTEAELLAAVLEKTRATPANGGAYQQAAPTLPPQDPDANPKA